MQRKRVKFLKFIDSNRLIYIYEWDIIAVASLSTIIYFTALTLLQMPIWASPFFASFSGWKTLKAYVLLIKDAAPGYLYHFFYSIGLLNPMVNEKKDGKNIKINPINLPFGFETDFRD